MAAREEWEQPPGSGEPATFELLLHVRTDGDLYLDLHYRRVHHYVLAVAIGDWRYDDVQLAANGHVVHEIELGSGAYLVYGVRRYSGYPPPHCALTHHVSCCTSSTARASTGRICANARPR